MFFPPPDQIDCRPQQHLMWFMLNLRKQFSRQAAHGQSIQQIQFYEKSCWSMAWNKPTAGAKFLATASDEHRQILIDEANMMLQDTGWRVVGAATRQYRHQVVVIMQYTR